MKKIAFQGVLGSFSSIAAKELFPDAQYIPYKTFEDAINATEQNETDCSIIPLENSHAGRVAEIHNILPKTTLFITQEHIVKIIHNLCGLYGAKIEEITHIYSHPQALMQSSQNIKKHTPNAQIVESLNTAIAAKHILESKDKTKACLCSSFAAKLFNLQVLKQDMQDSQDNTTKFICLGKNFTPPQNINEKCSTSILFEVKNIPSALYKALGGFATNGISMKKIESYIKSTGQNESAQFFVTLDGHINSKNMQNALNELKFFCKSLKILGCY